MLQELYPEAIELEEELKKSAVKIEDRSHFSPRNEEAKPVSYLYDWMKLRRKEKELKQLEQQKSDM